MAAAAAATSSDSPTGIPSLPPELFEKIAYSCEKRDLLNLRLANREVESKSLKAFATRSFTKLGVAPPLAKVAEEVA
jgi:hypothetical protein